MPNCFDLTDNANLPAGFEVWQIARPPTDDAEDGDTYAFFPATGVTTQQINLLETTTWSGRKSHFLWGNRAHIGTNLRANFVFPTIRFNPGADDRFCKIEYTSYALADAAMKVQFMYSLGYTQAEYEAVATAAGFATSDIIPHATLAADPATYFTQEGIFQLTPDDWATGVEISARDFVHNAGNIYYAETSGTTGATAPTHTSGSVSDGGVTWLHFQAGTTYSENRVMVDRVYLPVGRLADVPGTGHNMLMDTEQQDDGGGTRLVNLVTDLAQLCHDKGHTLTIYANTLTGGGASQTGFDNTTTFQVYDAADYLVMFFFEDVPESGMLESYHAQLNQIKAGANGAAIDPNKLIASYEVNTDNTTLQDDVEMRQIFEAGYIRQFMTFRNFAVQGGDCSLPINQKFKRVLFGHGTPRPAAITPI